jgi:TatA/E family protein of Tat protein translocase
MGIESPVHLLFIAVVALIVLGPKRLPDLARALGQGIREFRQSLDEGANQPEPHAPPSQTVTPAQPAAAGQTVIPAAPAQTVTPSASASSPTPTPPPPPDPAISTAPVAPARRAERDSPQD